MKYTLKDIAHSLSPEKRKTNGYWDRLVIRPVSYPVTWLALACGLSPNTVTWISVFIVITGSALFAITNGVPQWAGVGALFVFCILDAVDGNMARTTKINNPWGSWTDAVGGYIAYTATLLALGIAAERAGGFYGPAGLCIFLGGFSAATNMLMRACVQSHRTFQTALEGAPVKASPSGEKWISENLGITGIMDALIALGLALHFLHWVLYFYTLLYGIGSVWIILKLALTTKNSKPSRAQ
ncbi:MAG: CDP-alcohol phosphatidyltransferase family protein [Spirochaetales bacterium]|jgi:phosphatidylglycerophosphate synthase|nr:CDP-alcohol phosphatidyltransferase family protein [Spirochaetales bacterium]